MRIPFDCRVNVRVQVGSLHNSCIVVEEIAFTPQRVVVDFGNCFALEDLACYSNRPARTHDKVAMFELCVFIYTL
jgi:hypothetical protein